MRCRLGAVAAFGALFALGALLGPGAGAQTPDGVPVLMYHRIDTVVPPDPVGRDLTVDPAAFEAQLAWLRAHRIRAITMNDLADELTRGERPVATVVLTFDDGYADAATVATPLLVKYGARATFYVSAGFVGDGRHVSWAQLRAMRAAGMEIGCHGTRHLDLARLPPALAAREVDGCVGLVTHRLARPTTYAYAGGRWNALTLALMKANELKAALTERPGVVTSLAQPYTLPRRRVARGAGLTAFAALATP
jgi:peptidoglycan/xylan/chitin deacetylase (PgdA/CDA1 family)